MFKGNDVCAAQHNVKIKGKVQDMKKQGQDLLPWKPWTKIYVNYVTV